MYKKILVALENGPADLRLYLRHAVLDLSFLALAAHDCGRVLGRDDAVRVAEIFERGVLKLLTDVLRDECRAGHRL